MADENGSTRERSGQVSIHFVLNGDGHELTREQVETQLRGVEPELVRKHAVRVNGTWYPVRQAFERAVGVSRLDFVSRTARRHLAALGFEIHGDIEPRITGSTVQRMLVPSSLASPSGADGECWHTEANVQAAVVTALAADGWRIISVANTATKEHGIDVEAVRDGEEVGVEVKGFPSRQYADPARRAEAKRTQPSTQAGHWYAQAVLAAMRLRTKRPRLRSVVALPDFPRYRQLFEETRSSLQAAQIELWWVAPDGSMGRA